MKFIKNPEYENAQFEATCLDKDGKKLSEMMVCMLYGRPRPPRYKKNAAGNFEEVFAYIPEGKLFNP